MRNFLLSLLSLIDWIFIIGHNRQRLGDMVASTAVIQVDFRNAAADVGSQGV